MIQTIKTPRFLVLTLLIVATAATRALPLLVPHVWNFTAVGALGIFAGAQFSDKRLAFVMPLAAMAISDVFIGNGSRYNLLNSAVLELFEYIRKVIISFKVGPIPIPSPTI